MKIFKNVNTIFDKIKRGDIERSETRMFNRIDYYKKPELIKPHLHYLDNNRLQTNVDRHVERIYDRQNMINKIKFDRTVNKDKLYQDAQSFYRETFPEEVTADIFNMYHKEASKLDYEERTSKNEFRYKILDQLVDPVAKVVTKDSNLKSMIMTKNMVEYFSIMMAYQKQIDEEEFEDLKDQMKCSNPNGNGEGDNKDGDQPDGDSDECKEQGQPSGKAGKSSSDSKSSLTPEQMLEKLMNNKPMQQLQEELINDAKQQISDLSDMASEEEMQIAWEKGSSGFSKNDIDKVKREFDKLSINMDSIKAAIKKLLDRSTNYFTGKEIVEYNPIFDSDTLDGLQDFELLHPKLRKLMADDIMVKNVYREGKIDLYIDSSGSMDETFQYGDKWISKLDFAKVFALQMMKMNILRNIYTFDTNIRRINNTHYSILLMDDGGGTDINKVINQINKEQNNAIVITDAEDHCGIYSDKVYFIGVQGCRFNYFNDEVIKKYSENNQAIQFDGSGIRKIKKNGKVDVN
jgi:hypothetical protein